MNAFEDIKLRAVDAADYMTVSRSTLAKWRMQGYGPIFSRVGERVVVYRKADIDSWLQNRAAQELAKFEERRGRRESAERT